MDPRTCGLKPTTAAGKATDHGNEQNVQNGEEGPKRMDLREDGLKKPEPAIKANVHGPGTLKKPARADRGKEKVEENELSGQETGTRRRAEMLQPEIILPRYKLTHQNHLIFKLEFKEETRWEKKERRWRS
ncbi:hypothetical protein OIU84_003820 [Salix udensis]|uniref:Uncharacterized protein n=1 Tax=Salix udensis TaxID=889485 RepID=A0AAD6K0W7_9ROSI|nr:hypothetical protein OIU84_003820 [Salix udensis]